MNRRRFLAASALTAGGAVAPLVGWRSEEARPARPIPVPPDGSITVAFAIGPGVNVIDTAGPWEVFCDAAVARARGQFELFTVSASTDPVEGNSGLGIVPRYAYDAAPRPHVVVIPAHNATGETVAWLRHVAPRADLLMSVCTGAFVLAQTGLLDGKTATTHHGSYSAFAAEFPKVKLLRGRRYVEHERVATAGGLTSGIDLALRVVERYLGRPAATATARYLEYAGPR
jgi:transcriptional regulator GlxA family with amidase domain